MRTGVGARIGLTTWPSFSILGAVRVPATALLVVPILLSCASANESGGIDADDSIDAAADDGTPSGPDAATVAMCPAGQAATRVGPSGDFTCTTVDDATAAAIRARCSVYMGWRDSCTGCTNPPTKWSVNGPVTCSPGVGAGNNCIAATLDVPTQPVQLATVDLDGNVNDDDKIYTTLHCQMPASTPTPAPCQAGWAITGRSGNGWTCAPIADAVVGYVRTHCSIYLGWQDGCDACTLPPTKWGHANDTACVNGVGANDTCITTTLGTESVNLFGLNTGGDVDGNDKLHLGLVCDPPTTQPGTSPTMCPAGQFVAGTNVDGTLDCVDPSATVASYIDSKCSLFFGWRDSCDACTTGPAKWGRTSTSTCINGVGADDSCTAMTLGGTTVQMFGLSTDGDVNGDDTLYVGLRCDL
jgi:hypothetical protein